MGIIRREVNSQPECKPLLLFKTMNRMKFSGGISLELYPYVDTPVEAGREGRTYLLSIFQEAGLGLET